MTPKPTARAPRAVPQPAPSALGEIATNGLDLLTEDDGPVQYVVDGLIEPEDVVMLTGREKLSLKTWDVLDLAICRVLGADWFGRNVAKGEGKVLFVSCETSPRQVARRLKALCKGRGVAPEDVAGSLVFVFEPISIVPRSERTRVGDRADLSARLSAARTYDKDRRDALLGSASTIARREVGALGRNLDALEEIEDAPSGSYSLVVLDTLRQCLEGDENSSRDAARFTQGCRDLARAAGCPIIVTHHTNKSGDASDARSSRGSVELTAGPDVLLSIDTAGDNPTMHVTMRNGEAPAPIGYRLVDVDGDGGGLRLDVVDAAPAKGKQKRTQGVDDADVLDVLVTAGIALSVSNIRKALAKARGSAKGSKVNADATQRALDELETRGLVSKVKIEPKNGKPFVGYRAGTNATPDIGRRVNHDVDDVFGLGAPEDV